MLILQLVFVSATVCELCLIAFSGLHQGRMKIRRVLVAQLYRVYVFYLCASSTSNSADFWL